MNLKPLWSNVLQKLHVIDKIKTCRLCASNSNEKKSKTNLQKSSTFPKSTKTNSLINRFSSIRVKRSDSITKSLLRNIKKEPEKTISIVETSNFGYNDDRSSISSWKNQLSEKICSGTVSIYF